PAVHGIDAITPIAESAVIAGARKKTQYTITSQQLTINFMPALGFAKLAKDIVGLPRISIGIANNMAIPPTAIQLPGVPKLQLSVLSPIIPTAIKPAPMATNQLAIRKGPGGLN